jgi:hypothetical protein
VTIGWIERVVVSQQAIIGDLTPIKLGKERRKPVRVFVVDPEAPVAAKAGSLRHDDRPPVWVMPNKLQGAALYVDH